MKSEVTEIPPTDKQLRTFTADYWSQFRTREEIAGVAVNRFHYAYVLLAAKKRFLRELASRWSNAE